MQQSRHLVVAAASGYEIRTEKYQGRDHIVVPVVALVQGVVHAMNARNAELVTAEEFSRKPGGWNGRPIYLGHPERDGRPVSGNTPEILEESCIGIVFNTAIRKQKLTMEAWIDIERASKIAPELLSRIKAKRPIEISVGVYVDTDDADGEYDGKKYLGSWHDIVPDHLALLPSTDEGACSFDMGCGVRAAKEHPMNHMYVEWLEPGPETCELLKTLRDIPASERDKMPDADFAGPNRSFPIAKPEDVGAASHSLGRARGNRNEIKRKIISIAYRKGDAFVAELPETWKHKEDQMEAAAGIGSFLRGLLDRFRAAQTPDEMTDTDLRRKLYEALQEKEPNVLGVDAWFPVDDPSHVVYTCYKPSNDAGVEMGMGYQYTMYERAFDLSASGVVTLNEARIEVEPVMRYEPVEGAQPTAAKSAQKNAASGAPCSGCQHVNAPESLTSQKEKDMTKQEITKFLETATEEQLKALTAAAKTPTAEELKAAADKKTADEKIAADAKAAEIKAAADALAKQDVKTQVDAALKALTFEQILAKADPAQRDAILQGKASGEAKKASTIEALKATKRCSYTDDELKAMDQAQLDRLVELAGSNVRAAIDFGGLGAPKDLAANKNEAPAPPSLDEALKADRAAKK